MSVLARSRKYLGILIWIFVFILCADDFLASGNIVFMKEEKTWQGAVKHCKSMNGRLITPSDVNKTKTCLQENEEFWIGEVTTLSSWMDILGCYKVETPFDAIGYVKEVVIAEPSPAICEQICKEYSSVFGLMGKKCFCVRNITSLRYLELLTKKTRADMCNKTCVRQFPRGSCGGFKHITMYERVFDRFIKRGDSKPCDSVCKCVVMECSYGVKLKQESSCQTYYAIECRKYSANINQNNWKYGVENCYDSKEYLADLNTTCGSSSPSGPFWTSTFRNYATLEINEILSTDIVTRHVNTNCSSAKFNYKNQTFSINRNKFCIGTRLHFFCKIDSDVNSNMSCDPTPSQPTKLTGIIIGSVVACLLVAAGVVVFICFLKYRSRSTKKKESTDSNYEGPVNPSDKGENSGFAYDLVNPTPNIKTTASKYNTNQESGYELAYIPNHNRNNYSLGKNPGTSKVKEMKSKDTDYELASIPKKTDNDYVYSDTVDGDYDLLNRKNDRKKNINNKEDTNFYSHTDAFDGTYDTTNIKSHECDISDTYDHAQISKVEVAGNDKENDPYDHTNI